MAAVLAAGDGAVLSYRSAAFLWGIFRSRQYEIDVTTPFKRRPRAGLRLHHSHLPADEVTTRDGIPVTTVPRTLFDLAGIVSAGQLARAVAEAESRRLWDSLSLAGLLTRHPRRPGAAVIRAVIDGDSGITRSDLEDLFVPLVRSARLPRPETNGWLLLGGSWIEADCIWRRQRLIVELDGGATHATRRAFETDRARDRALIAAGWRVIRITWPAADAQGFRSR